MNKNLPTIDKVCEEVYNSSTLFVKQNTGISFNESINERIQDKIKKTLFDFVYNNYFETTKHYHGQEIDYQARGPKEYYKVKFSFYGDNDWNFYWNFPTRYFKPKTFGKFLKESKQREVPMAITMGVFDIAHMTITKYKYKPLVKTGYEEYGLKWNLKNKTSTRYSDNKTNMFSSKDFVQIQAANQNEIAAWEYGYEYWYYMQNMRQGHGAVEEKIAELNNSNSNNNGDAWQLERTKEAYNTPKSINYWYRF